MCTAPLFDGNKFETIMSKIQHNSQQHPYIYLLTFKNTSLYKIATKFLKKTSVIENNSYKLNFTNNGYLLPGIYHLFPGKKKLEVISLFIKMIIFKNISFFLPGTNGTKCPGRW